MRGREATARTRAGRGRPRADAPGLDPALLGAVAALVCLGVLMVASASVSVAEQATGDALYYLRRQLAALAVGLAVGTLIVRTPSAVVARSGGFLLLLTLGLLALVLFPGLGRTVNGSTRWLDLGVATFQPSELMKLVFIVYLAGYLVRREEEVRARASGFFKPVAVLGVIALLLLLEPDYGATVIIFATALGMLFLAGVPWPTFLAWLAMIAAAMLGLAVAAPYRLARLTSFLDPWQDPFDSGFQLSQALIAVGRGGWLGVGLGESVQKLFYLPEAHTDFILAVLAEELGLAGVAVVVALYGVVLWRAFAIAGRALARGERFCAHLAHGLGLLVSAQGLVSIGVNLGLLPTKGLALPFVSYGGNSLVINLMAVALLLRIDRECPPVRGTRARPGGRGAGAIVAGGAR